MTPRRIQRRRTKGSKMQEGAVYVGRGSKWGNPFTVASYLDAGYKVALNEAKRRVVESFRIWLGPRYCDIWNSHQSASSRLLILDSIHNLRGKDLACWCSLCEKHKDGRPWNEPCSDCSPCHADPLLELVNEETAP